VPAIKKDRDPDEEVKNRVKKEKKMKGGLR